MATRIAIQYWVSISLFCFPYISSLCLHLLNPKAKRPPKHQLLHPCPLAPPLCHLTTTSSSFLILEPEPLHLRPLALTLDPNLEIEKESKSFARSLFLIQIGGRLTCPRNFDGFPENYKWTVYGFIPRSSEILGKNYLILLSMPWESKSVYLFPFFKLVLSFFNTCIIVFLFFDHTFLSFSLYYFSSPKTEANIVLGVLLASYFK